MANWANTIKLSPYWDDCVEGKITVQELAGAVFRGLSNLKPIPDEWLEEERQLLMDNFQCLSEDMMTDMVDFDHFMEDLYDWGDSYIPGTKQKTCWITNL